MAPLSTESNAQPTKEEFFEDKTKELNQKRETALKKNKIVVYINTLVLTFYHLAGLYGLYLTFKSVKWATIGFGKSSLIVLYSALIYYLGHSWTWQAQIIFVHLGDRYISEPESSYHLGTTSPRQYHSGRRNNSTQSVFFVNLGIYSPRRTEVTFCINLVDLYHPHKAC